MTSKQTMTVLPLLLWVGGWCAVAEFFVAPGGDDAHPGTRTEPFASFPRAQQAVRGERVAHPDRGVTVTVLAGRYELSAPLEFGPADSGASSVEPVVYRAEPGAVVEISGGRRIDGWQPDPQRPGVWKTRVSPDAADRFEQLWVNGRRAIRARTPNEWQFHTVQTVAEAPLPEDPERFRHTFTVRPDCLSPLAGLDEAALHDVQALVFHKWDTTREWLQTIDPETGTFETQGAFMKDWNPMTRDCLFFFENALAALDAPGEWFLDREGWLFYWPRPGEDLSPADVVAPRIDGFLRITGATDDPAEWVRHLRFEGLQFRHAEFHIPDRGLAPQQAAMNVEAAAVLVDRARDIQFRDCAVEHIGSTAFWFRQACRDCRVERTRMFDLGVSGVRIGEERIAPEASVTRAITIDNCIIQSGGRILPHAVGVWIGHSPSNAVTHCNIADFYYTAVSVGWRWGYDASPAKGNRIEFNHLHHLGYRILSDMGGVYTLGPSEGTRVCNNLIHDVHSTRYGGWGLYPDEGSTGILFENNLVYDVHDGCVHQHYGKDNIFRNNILAFSEQGQIAVTRAEPHLSFTFEHNIVIWNDGFLLGYSGWKNGAQINLRSNLYWRVGGQPFDFAGKSWDEWRALGNDPGSIIADPLFADAEQRNFVLQPDSPAGQIGFRPFDFTRAGVYGDPDWKHLAASIEFPDPYIVPDPEPVHLVDGFEGGGNTPLLDLATLHQEDREDLISITDTVAAQGTHSLRIQDHPELEAGYNPHFYLDPHYSRGQGRLAFRIRLDPGADVQAEWRDNASPYHVGPSLQFRDRALHSRGRKLMDLPENSWVFVEMRAPLGGTNRIWSLAVTLPDGARQTFTDLACDPEWNEARWVGFSSSSADQVAYYLDDMVLEQR